jgi:hypothetical protein
VVVLLLRRSYYVIGERTLRLVLERRLRVVSGKKLKFGKYTIVKRYIVSGVVSGCSGKS